MRAFNVDEIDGWPISITCVKSKRPLCNQMSHRRGYKENFTIRLNVTKPKKGAANPSGSYKISIDNIP